MNIREFALVSTLVLAACNAASGSPISYVYSTVGTGSLNGAAFTDALVAITVNGDTVGVTHNTNFYYSNTTNALVTVAGTGTANITDDLQAYNSISSGFAGLLDNTAFSLFLEVNNPVLNGYKMTSSFGPVTGSTSGSLAVIGTAAGSFKLDQSGPQATFEAIATVPEPAYGALVGVGLLMTILLPQCFRAAY